MTVLLVDARAPHGSGLGRYLRESVRALSESGRFSEIVLAGPRAELESVRGTMRGMTRVIDLDRGRYDPRVIWRWGSIAAQVGAPHRTWFPNWDGSWHGASGTSAPVTTIHDLIQLDHTTPREWVRAAIAAPWMRRMIAASRQVVTVSEHSRARLLERFPEAAGRITVIPNGVAPVFLPRGIDGPASSREAPLPALRALGVAGPYLLTVANKKPHKNLELVIRAFARLATVDAALRLVLVGDRFPHLTRLMTLARSLGVADRIHDLARIPDAQLAALYRQAEVCLFPSRQEGFGMPVLEAMAAGVPVIAVDVPPISTLVGEAAILVPVDDVEGMAAAVDQLRRDPAQRAARIEAGRAQAATYTWDRSAAALADLLGADARG